jgi:hypothetical protein
LIKLYPEPLLFCAAWAALAIVGGLTAGWMAGALLSLGLLLIITPLSSLMLTRTENLGAERTLRWSVLACAAVGLLLWLKA